MTTVRTLAFLGVALLLLAAWPLGPAAASGHATTPTFITYAGPAEYRQHNLVIGTAGGAGEPSVGVNWNTGAILLQHGFDTFRVAPNASSTASVWTKVSPPVNPGNVDPLLFTDAESGRTFAGGLDGTCSVLSFTDDDGQTWTPVSNACVATLDHPSIVSGPWRNGVKPPQATSDRAVHYCGQSGFVMCTTSLDGGLTFSYQSQVSCYYLAPGLHGSLHIGPDGRVYLPFKDCGGKIGVARSETNGLTWLWHQVAGSASPSTGFDPDVATSTDGRVWIGFQNQDNGSYVAWSDRGGRFFSAPVDVSSHLGIQSTTFHEMVAGDGDRAALAFLGTTTPGDAFAAGFTGVWHLYVATTYDGGATWTTVQATTDPVQRGFICAGGVSCEGGRNLLDFMDAQLDERGRIVVSYADGCIGACAADSGTIGLSTSSASAIARQSGGLGLFAEHDAENSALSGSPGGSYDASGPALLRGSAAGGAGGHTFSWSLLDAPAESASATFEDPSNATTLFTPDVPGTYRVRLTLGDAAGAARAYDTTVRVLGDASLLDDDRDDARLPGTDIVRARVVAEDSTTFTLRLEVAGLANSPPSTATVVGIPFGAQQAFTVGFQHEESPGNLVSYQLSASKYAAALPSGATEAFELQTRGAGDASNWVTELATLQGTWDADNGHIEWIVPKDALTVKQAPTGPSDEGDLTNGQPPVAGDVLDGWSAECRSWFFALVGLGPGATIWDDAVGSGTHELKE